MLSLRITRPIRSSRISQKFGENAACVTATGKIITATNGICLAGSKPFYQSMGMKGHTGIDMPSIHGETVVHAAMYDGWMKIEKDMQGGIGVDVISNEPVKLKDGTESYIKMRYWHLKSPIGWDKKPVKYGQPIGLADNTGASSGDHLHWAPKRCTKEGITLDNNNGYGGAFDPMPYYNNSIYASDDAHYLKLAVNELTEQERKEMNSQLSTLRRIALQLRELAYRI